VLQITLMETKLCYKDFTCLPDGSLTWKRRRAAFCEGLRGLEEFIGRAGEGGDLNPNGRGLTEQVRGWVPSPSAGEAGGRKGSCLACEAVVLQRFLLV
jgi:hypothetical protein